MTKEETKKKIEKLIKEINYHNYLYHVLDAPEIEDAVFDGLKNELVRLEKECPELIRSDSPTQRVGGKPLDKFEKVEHASSMMSLFDAFSEKDMCDWEKRNLNFLEKNNNGQWDIGRDMLTYYCELKMDGLAMSLIYKNGVFIRGATRGNGKVGENVTQNLKTIEAIPLSLRKPSKIELKKIGFSDEQIKKINLFLEKEEIEIRGEAIMTNEVFRKLNERYKKEGRPLLANPRNGAAGSIRQLDSKITAERKLDFYVYAVLTDFSFKNHNQEHELAKLLGFKVLKENKVCGNLKEVLNFHHEIEKKRAKIPFECDGVVVVVNDLRFWNLLGVVGKGPRYMMAYKFTAIQAITRLKEVVWQVGRTGVLTPTAVLEPVRVGGVTITHATLHNMDEITRLDVRIGDTVVLERAGDVIPKIIKVMVNLRDKKEEKIAIPERCPMCGGVVVKVENEVAYRCINVDCYAVNLRRLMHWASKGALDVEGLGPKIIEQLMKKGLVSDIADFFSLTEGDLKPLERFADKSAENLIKAISAKKEINLARFIFGLGIRHIGEESSIALSKEFGSWGINDLDGIIERMPKIELEKLQDISDFGPIVAQSVYEWFNNEHNLELLKKLRQNGVEISRSFNSQNSKFVNKIFVLTGILEGLTRDEAKAKIRELGGSISSAVSKKTDYVIVGAEPGSKFEKANKLGVMVVNEEEFIKMLNTKI